MASKKLKRIIRNIHLYLGLASGLVVFIVAITGCCWAFREEIVDWQTDSFDIVVEDRSFITPTLAKALALKAIPDKHIHGTAYGQKGEPLEVIFYEAEPLFYQSVFLNPYDGELLKIENHLSGFFWFVMDGHLHLWLPKAIGSQITAYGTMIFVVMLLSGIVLWWPKKKKNRGQRFRLDWKSTTRWKRKNFDLHAVVGFYASLFALVIAFSGLIMAFNWIYYVTYLSWGGDKAPQFIVPNNVSSYEAIVSNEVTQPIDQLIPMLIEECPDYKNLEVHYPKTDSASIYIEVSHQRGIHYSSDYRFFDQNTLAEIETPGIYGKYENADLADKVIRMNYDIHVGAIGGLFGKIIAFIISFVTASLPVTGVLLWWGRKSKKTKGKNSPIGSVVLKQINPTGRNQLMSEGTKTGSKTYEQEW